MPKFRVETPNGTYEVEAPEGTTEEQIKAEIAKTQEIENRPEINNVAEGVRTFAKGATFGFADEGEAYLRSRSGGDRLTTTDDYKSGYEEYKTLPAYNKRNEQQKARGLELSNLLQNQKQIKNDEVDAKQNTEYRQERDTLRASNAEFARQNPKTALALELAGGIATPMAGVGALKGASTLAKIGGGIVQGGTYGALYGAGNAEEMADVPDAVMEQGGIGALTGGALSTVGSIVAPKLQRGAKSLMDKNIKLTPGQAMGGWVDKAEQTVGTVMPGVNKARNRAIRQWNESIIDDVIKPLGTKITAKIDDDIHQLVDKGQKALSQSYDEVLPFISMKSDSVFKQAVKQIQKSQVLGSEASKKAGRELRKIQGFLKGNKISGQSIKDIQSHLGKRINAYAGTTNADDKAVGTILEDTLDALMDAVERQNPKYAERLKTINMAYAKFIRIENASKKLNGDDFFTPKQFGQSVRQSDTSKRGRQVSAGKALMQDVGKKGQILGTTQPDSGTAQNAIANGLLLASPSLSLVNPALAGPPIATALGYSKTGINMINKYLDSGGTRQGLRELLKKYSGTATSGLLTLQD
jgi:hypothetical protein